MGAIPNSDLESRSVSPDQLNYRRFADMAHGEVDWAATIPSFAIVDYVPRQKWFEREDARWLIIRGVLRACAKKGIRDVAHRMELLGCSAQMGLSDILRYISKDWDPAGTWVSDLQWLAGWDIEFCRATGDWTLLHFNLGLLQNAAELNGQALTPVPERTTSAADGSKPHISLRLLKDRNGEVFAGHPSLARPVLIARHADVVKKIAQQLGVKRQTVNNVLNGKWRSKRISAALLAAGLIPVKRQFSANPKWRLLKSQYATIARELGVTATAVWFVANGRSYSASITAALDRHLAPQEAGS